MQLTRSLEAHDSALSFFGSRLRDLRVRGGLSQDRLASAVHVSGDLLSKIERALRRPTPDLVERLDAVLGADGGLLMLATSIWDDTGDRLALGDFPIASARAGDPSMVGAELVTALGGVLEGLRHMDHSLGSGSVVGSVLAQAKVAEGLLAASAGAVRTSLLGVLAETYQLAGWNQFDQDNPAAADRSFRQARDFAVEANDPALLAFILGPSHGFAATYSGNPEFGLQLAERAEDPARRSGNHRLIAFVLAVQARALARLGDVALCGRQLDAAAEQLARHDEGEGDPAWLSVFDDAALLGHRGSCELDLDRPEPAIAALGEQDASAPEEFVRNRTIWLLDRANAHVARNEPEMACADVRLAWAAASGTSSRRMIRKFRSTAAALGRWQANAEVVAVREMAGLSAARG